MIFGGSSIVAATSLPEISTDTRIDGDVQEFMLSGIEFTLGAMLFDPNFDTLDFGVVLELGTRLNVYRFEHGFLQPIDDIHWYPLLSDGEVIFVVSVHGDPNSPTIIINDEFATVLQNFRGRDSSPFALLFMGANLYAVTESDMVFLRSYAVTDAESVIAPFADFDSRSVNMQFGAVDVVAEVVPDVMSAMARSNMIRTLAVPVVGQGVGTRLCWASVVSSVEHYFYMSRNHRPGRQPHTASNVALARGIHPNTGANIGQLRETLVAFGVPLTNSCRVINSSPSLANIRELIFNWQSPIPTLFHPQGNPQLMGHYVLFRSYNFNANTGQILLSYMDSALMNGFGNFAMIFNPPATGRLSISYRGSVIYATQHLPLWIMPGN